MDTKTRLGTCARSPPIQVAYTMKKSILHARHTKTQCGLPDFPPQAVLAQLTMRTHPKIMPDCVAEPCSSVTSMSREFPASAGRPSM